MMGFVDKFIGACYTSSRKEFKRGRPYLRLVTPDGYSTYLLDLSEWNPEEQSLVDFMVEKVLPWFQNMINLYEENEDGEIVRKGADSEATPDIEISVEDLIAKAQELGLEG